MIKTLYVRVILTFLGIIIFSLICSFLIGLYVFQKQISYEGQNEMIAVGKEIIHRYDDAKPKDKDEFLNSMVKVSAYPIHLYNPSGNIPSMGSKIIRLSSSPPKLSNKCCKESSIVPALMIRIHSSECRFC